MPSKKIRISTTISIEHHSMLKKLAEKYKTMQKTLEKALEVLLKKQYLDLSSQEQYWLELGKLPSLCIIHKDLLIYYITAMEDSLDDISKIVREKGIGIYPVVHYLKKPLNEATLPEVLKAIVEIARVSHWFETIDYDEGKEFYFLKITHYGGRAYSKAFMLYYDSLFQNYGVKTKTTVTDYGMFLKIFKPEKEVVNP